MEKYTLTCNCYEPPTRENITVTADSIDEAWNKAKKKFARKIKAKIEDVNITACHRN